MDKGLYWIILGFYIISYKKILKFSNLVKIYIPLLKWDISKNIVPPNRKHKIELPYKESRDLLFAK